MIGSVLKVDDDYYTIKSKRELLSKQWQDILKKKHKSERSPEEEKFILCTKCNVNMYVAKRKNFYLVSQKRQALNHKKTCVFFDPDYEYIYNDEGDIELSSSGVLFRKYNDKDSVNIKIDKKIINEEVELERKDQKEKNRFSEFMFSIIDQAYVKAFNILNKNKDRISGDLLNPTLEHFSKILLSSIFNTQIRGKSTVKEYIISRGFRIKVGIIEHVEEENDEWIKYKDLSENYTRNLPRNIWEKAKRNVQIYRNIISPPYLYIKIYKGKEVYRFYIMAIANTKYFVPVESQLERNRINEIIVGEKLTVYKPLTVYFIQRVLTKKYAKTFFEDKRNIYRPDLFIFEKGKIRIVEIVDKNMLNNKDYLNNLKRKEKIFSNIKHPFVFEKR